MLRPSRGVHRNSTILIVIIVVAEPVLFTIVFHLSGYKDANALPCDWWYFCACSMRVQARLCWEKSPNSAALVLERKRRNRCIYIFLFLINIIL